MTDPLTRALKSALAFAASRSAISSAQERAILACWEDAMYIAGLSPLTAEDQARIDAAWETHKAAAPFCEIPPEGWFCTRNAGHIGPCAARPISELCPSSPHRIHIVDTSMESGPNNCFHCGDPMARSDSDG